MTQSQINQRYPCTRTALAAALLRVLPGFSALDSQRAAEERAKQQELQLKGAAK